MRLLPAADRTATQWKNGGGQTSEVAIFPSDAGLDDFEWRISLASVSTAGRFSHFHNTDRVLAVIDGTLELAIDGQSKAIQLNSACAPLSFSGDVEVVATPLGGDVTDLNLMTRRDRWAGTIERIAAPALASSALLLFDEVIIFSGDGRLHLPEQTIDIRPRDAIRFDAPEGVTAVLETRHDVYRVRLSSIKA